MTVCLHVDAPHFCAGVIINQHGRVVEAAPILRYMLGWSRAAVRMYARKKRWKLIEV